jgi:hypothetical protein
MNEIEERILDLFLEHELGKMEERKIELEEEWYLYTKCVGIPNLKQKVILCK